MIAGISKRRRAVYAVVALLAGLVVIWRSQESRASEKASKGWLGVSVQELTPSAREKMKLGNASGLLVTDVVRDSPAEEAGIREDDVIMEFDGKKVEQADDFSQLVRQAGADKKVALLVMRAGEKKTFEVILGKRRSPSSSSWFSHGFGEGFGAGRGMHAMMKRPRLGVQVHELDENLAAYFKVAPHSGVVVLEVSKESPAEKAGLKSGDVIAKLDSETIRDAESLVETLQDYESGDQVKIEYVRQGKRATATVELADNADSSFHFFAPGHERLRVRPYGGSEWDEARREDEFPDAESRNEELLRFDLERNMPRELDVRLFAPAPGSRTL